MIDKYPKIVISTIGAIYASSAELALQGRSRH